MATKTITVTERAYRRLRSHKLGDESFSDVILRLTERRPLADFAGILSPESGRALKEAIEASRRERRTLDEER